MLFRRPKPRPMLDPDDPDPYYFDCRFDIVHATESETHLDLRLQAVHDRSLVGIRDRAP